MIHSSRRRSILLILLSLAVSLLILAAAGLGLASFLFGGPAIYSNSQLVSSPQVHQEGVPNLTWWTIMTEYVTPAPLAQVQVWYQNIPCTLGYDSPIRCDLDHYNILGVDFTRFLVIQTTSDQTTSIQLVTMIGVRS